jgi:hypothetical protein
MPIMPPSAWTAVSVRDSLNHVGLALSKEQSLERDECLLIVENRSDEPSCFAANGTGAAGLKLSGCGAD